MKKILLSAFIILGLVGVFKALNISTSAILSNDLTSSTRIEPDQSFVLGEGNHGGYRAKISNDGKVDVEVFGERENEERTSLGILKPQEKGEYDVAKNTKVIFKNLGSKTATIGIKIYGDAGLSMGYKPNNQ